MLVPLSWLRDFAPFPADVADLAARLSGLGLVVEGLTPVGGLEGVVVARVEATRTHPDADRVQLVDVVAGDGTDLQIVCGAFNFGPGDLVPLATVGTTLAGGLTIARRKVRGQWSEGMLCSGAELGLPDDTAGIMVLSSGAPGQPLAEALGLAPDVVFDLDVTPNRPDALSMLGVARDLAANLGLPLTIPTLGPAPGPAPAIATVAPVTVTAGDLCPRFTATVLEGVVGGETPPWMAARLRLAGMRPISPVVDISNYVMLELGHPNHPYDRDRLPGGGLSVRRAGPGETLETLDGTVRRLAPGDCLIADAEGTAVGIAGIMGGATSEIGPATTAVVLEVAAFDPMAVATTSRRLGLRTEASVRFERGVDPAGLERAVARFCELAAAVAGARCGPVTDRSEPAPPPAPVMLRTGRLNRLLGTELRAEEIAALLEPIGFATRTAERGADPAADALVVTIPTWRPDASREVDVVEEVARHHGYNRIARTVPAVRGLGRLGPGPRRRRRLRDVLVGAGLAEAWSTSLLAPADLARAAAPTDAVELENPLTSDESVLRTSLRPGLLRALATNAAHRHPEVELFELGRVFRPPLPGADLPREPEHLAVAGSGRDAGWAKTVLDGLVAELGLAADLDPGGGPGLHPGRSATVVVYGEGVGAVGELDPELVAAHGLEAPVAYLEVDLDAVTRGGPRTHTYRPVSRYPSADFDLAFVLEDATPAAALEAALRRAAADTLEELGLFDVFRGPGVGRGQRSLAYRIRVVAQDHTLSERELAAIRNRCIDAARAVGAVLRG